MTSGINDTIVNDIVYSKSSTIVDSAVWVRGSNTLMTNFKLEDTNSH